MSSPPASPSSSSQRVLLPDSVAPIHYRIRLEPDLSSFTFEGSESVRIRVRRPCDSLTLHAKDLTILQASVRPVAGDSGEPIQASRIGEISNDTEQVVVSLPVSLAPGEYEAFFSFRGNLNDQMAGFYRSKYTVDGQERYMAVTQFEPTDARRAFPCWDEPALKATFQVTLVVPKHLHALNNMPVEHQALEGDRKVVAFGTTPIMSTYLVAFVVGEFDYVEDRTAEGILMRVYTPVGKAERGKFALEVGCKVLSYFTDYFGIPFPLPKQDMIAIPDFAAGAMENWGLITYREIALLIDPHTSSFSQRQRVAYVVAHELAHQWFGNLVTMEWWRELWLNEGFATFVGNQAVNHLYPRWNIWQQFVTDYVNRALREDSLLNSHPIEVEVFSSAQVNEIFDAISYCKGAAVIRMCAEYLGEKAMRQGLKIYLERHKYKNAKTGDLWRALSESSGKNVAEFMDKYVKDVGYPVVTFEHAGGRKFRIGQERFLAAGPSVLERKGPEESASGKPNWFLALRLAVPGKELGAQVESEAQVHECELEPSVASSSWIKANAGQSGFFRVRYSDDLLRRLIVGIRSLEIPPVDRLGVQSDAFALAKAGYLGTHHALELARAYRNERDLAVLTDLSSNLADVMSVWRGEPTHTALQGLIRDLFAPLGEELGWDPKPDEPELDALKRSLALGMLIKGDHQPTIQEARARFQRFLVDSKSLPADLRAMVFRAVVHHGGHDDYEAVLKVYREADMHEEKIRALQALGGTAAAGTLRRTLDWGLSDEVRGQDVMFVVASTAGSLQGRVITWQWLKDRWSELSERFGSGQFLLVRIVGFATNQHCTEEMADQVERFFQENPCAPAERTIKQSLETIRANAAWLRRDRAAVAEFLQQMAH